MVIGPPPLLTAATGCNYSSVLRSVPPTHRPAPGRLNEDITPIGQTRLDVFRHPPSAWCCHTRRPTR